MVNRDQAGHLPDLFFRQVEKYGQRVALRHKDYGIWNRISWRDYGQGVRETAFGLLSFGLHPGRTVTILGDNRPEWLVCHLAAMTAAGVTCGIYPTSSPDEIRYIVQHSDSEVLFVENEEQVDKVLQIIDELEVVKVVVWDPKGLWGFEHPRIMFYQDFLAQAREYQQKHPDEIDGRLASLEPDDTAMIIYTSGTTGRPKGAMISHANILAITAAFTGTMEARETDETLSYLPLAHIYENLISVFQAIWTGSTVNFVESMDTLAQNLREVSPTVFASVPRIWEKFASAIEIRMSDATYFKRFMYRLAVKVGRKWFRSPQGSSPRFRWGLAYWPLYWLVLYNLKRNLGFEHIRFAICGAAPASPELFEFFNTLGVKLREGYGQTESTGVIALTHLNNPRWGYVGQALPGMEIKIAEDGEILVRGPGVFKGYF
ncbi:MAG: AMP-binding protein, partial [Pseudomonadota bacterium]